LVAALTLAALLKLSMLELPRWHLAFWYGGITIAVLLQSMPVSQALANGGGSFFAAWLYFLLLYRTDNVRDRSLHWLVLVSGFLALIAARFYIDIRAYGIGL